MEKIHTFFFIKYATFKKNVNKEKINNYKLKKKMGAESLVYVLYIYERIALIFR